MDDPLSRESSVDIAELVGSLRKRGIRLWLENGALHYEAPKGALTHEDIATIRGVRCRVTEFLGIAIDPELDGSRGSLSVRSAPLAFSQLAHWNLYQLGVRRSVILGASATRLQGDLRLDVLLKSLEEIIRRQGALRTRIVVRKGVPMQEISQTVDCNFLLDDRTKVPEGHREEGAIHSIERFVSEPLDVTAGPLFRVQLLRVRNDEHILVIALEHIISDAYSMNLLLRDIFSAYRQEIMGEKITLPTIDIQFSEYAIAQRNMQKTWIQKSGRYWNEHMAGCRRLRFPTDMGQATAARVGWGSVPFRIQSDAKMELRDWCRRRQTTLVMSIFTAYVGAVLRWCNVQEGVILYQVNGRTDVKIENTIGYFAGKLPLRLSLFEGDTFTDLKNRVIEEYCNAHEHADSSYLEALMPQPAYMRNSMFNWIGYEPRIEVEQGGAGTRLITSAVEFEYVALRNLEIDYEPSIVFFDVDNTILGKIQFPLSHFSTEMMSRFARSCAAFILALLKDPEQRVSEVPLL